MIMPFGKYAGRAISGIPSNYLKWLMENMEDESLYELMEAAEKEWNDRETWQRHIPFGGIE